MSLGSVATCCLIATLALNLAKSLEAAEEGSIRSLLRAAAWIAGEWDLGRVEVGWGEQGTLGCRDINDRVSYCYT